MRIKLKEVDGIMFDPENYKEQKKMVPELRKISENRYVVQSKRRSKFLEKNDFIVIDRINDNIYVLEKDFINNYMGF